MGFAGLRRPVALVLLPLLVALLALGRVAAPSPACARRPPPFVAADNASFAAGVLALPSDWRHAPALRPLMVRARRLFPDGHAAFAGGEVTFAPSTPTLLRGSDGALWVLTRHVSYRIDVASSRYIYKDRFVSRTTLARLDADLGIDPAVPVVELRVPKSLRPDPGNATFRASRTPGPSRCPRRRTAPSASSRRSRNSCPPPHAPSATWAASPSPKSPSPLSASPASQSGADRHHGSEWQHGPIGPRRPFAEHFRPPAPHRPTGLGPPERDGAMMSNGDLAGAYRWPRVHAGSVRLNLARSPNHPFRRLCPSWTFIGPGTRRDAHPRPRMSSGHIAASQDARESPT